MKKVFYFIIVAVLLFSPPKWPQVTSHRASSSLQLLVSRRKPGYMEWQLHAPRPAVLTSLHGRKLTPRHCRETWAKQNFHTWVSQVCIVLCFPGAFLFLFFSWCLSSPWFQFIFLLKAFIMRERTHFARR